jgi:hypothetical protein
MRARRGREVLVGIGVVLFVGPAIWGATRPVGFG